MTIDPTMLRIRAIWQKKKAAGLTLAELGAAMGFPEAQAKQAAHQFLRGNDPHASSVRRFAKAMGVSAARLMK